MTTTDLNAKAFHLAQNFIETHARPIDIARFKLHFQNGSVDAVLDALAAYQNADGGFGNGLEPDLRAPESSAICTSVAFQILNELRLLDKESAAQSMIKEGLTYLLQTLDQDKLHWRIVPLEVANSPRAPWWHEDGRAHSFDEFSLNPTAEILGILYDYQDEYNAQYREHIPDGILEKIAEKVMQTLSELAAIEMHDLYCCLRLLKAKTLPAGTSDLLCSKLTQLAMGTVVTAPEQWQNYGLRPLDVVDGPDSPFMAGLADAVAANLDFEIAEQKDDGSWMPTWTWGDLYPEVWGAAQIEWAGCITLGKLQKLQKFGRI